MLRTVRVYANLGFRPRHAPCGTFMMLLCKRLCSLERTCFLLLAGSSTGDLPSECPFKAGKCGTMALNFSRNSGLRAPSAFVKLSKGRVDAQATH